MLKDEKNTLTEKWIRRIKNNPFVAILIIVSMVIVGISTFTDSATKLFHLVFPQKYQETKTPSATGNKISETSAEHKENSKADLHKHDKNKGDDERVYKVKIGIMPVTTNYDATIKPATVELNLDCGQNKQHLETLNYPVTKLFVWSPKKCGDTILTISIGDTEISRKYSGPLGFPEFLREFNEGKRVFRSNEFSKKEAKVLREYGIEFINVSFYIRGADPVKEYLSQ